MQTQVFFLSTITRIGPDRHLILCRTYQTSYLFIEMAGYLFSVVYFIFFLTSSVVMVSLEALLRIITGPFDKRLILVHKFAGLWASLYIWTMPHWRITVKGKEKIDHNKAYVIVSNHQSMLDILAAYMIRAHFKFVSKAELFKVPFVGWNMMLNRHVRLKREDRASIMEMMKDSLTHLDQGNSIYIFPEGTRSEDGEIKKFKQGAFTLAKRARVPILPVVLDGTGAALPKGKLFVKLDALYHLKVNVLDPIPYETFAEKTTAEITDEVRSLMVAELTKERMSPASVTNAKEA